MRPALLAAAMLLWPVLPVVTALAEAPRWNVLAEESRVGFVAYQAGAPVEGVFESFEAEVVFDPERLAESRVKVVIDVGSVETQSADRDEAIRSAGLFDVATWPTAKFEATRFTEREDGGFVAGGALTMRDQTRAIELPFSLKTKMHNGKVLAHAVGEVTVSRLDYGIGQGQWQDTSVVADEVTIKIEIQAERPQ